MMLQAKALYDNIAETPEELAFRRGDILSVIEQDASGLEGWWLCSIKGRRGIVPGNRLRLLDKSLAGDGGTPESNGHRVKTDHAAVTEALKTWHQQHRVVTPKKQGSTFVYDVPHRAISEAKNSDYDVPPSRSPSAVSRSSSKMLPRPSECDYDHPTVRGGPTEQKQMDPSQLLKVQMSTLDHYDVPGSNRSSTISVMSTGSSLSAVSSGSCPHSSVCESERSSLDLSAQDMYDVPPAARALNTASGTRPTKPNDPTYDTPKPHPKYVKSSPLTQQDAMNDDYDVLKSCSGGNIYNTPRKDCSLTYDTPKLSKPVSRNCSADSGISLPIKNNHVYDVPNYNLAAHQAYDSPRSLGVKPLEDAEYDTPRPSRTASSSPARVGTPVSGETARVGTPVSGDSVSVYDVPPRVTKDTGDSLTIKEEIKRASSGSSDSDFGPFPYEELRMELSAAMECLVGLQHCINKSCSKLLAFVHPNWRTQQSLEPRVYEIKLSTVAVRKAAELFVEFAQGALVNASKSEDKKLTNRLCKAVDTLGEAVQTFNQCLDNLNKEMWPLVTLVRSQDAQVNTEDNLDTVVRVTKDLPEYIRSISGLIQGNSMHLFKRSGSQGNTTMQLITSTPKSKVKSPPPTMPKPRVSVTSPECGVPMPKFVPKSPDVASDSAPEQAERPLSDICKNTSETTDKDVPDSDYDVPKSLAKSEVQNNNVGPQGTEKNPMEEYDYVRLMKKPDCSAGKEKSIEPEDGTTAVEMREKRDKLCDNDNNPKQGSSGRAKVVQSLFPPPDVRTSGLSETFKDRLEKLQKEAEEPVKIYSEDYDVPQSHAVGRTSSRSQSVNVGALHSNDRLILQFYATQVETHSNILVNAIEAFLKCIEEHQSPKTFIAYSKFVILAAHKIVYIGDTLTRHLLNDNIRNDVMNHAYTLCELLKDTVTATKKAALEYPGITCVQDMVDRVSEVSVAANGLKQIITRFAS